MLKRVRIGDLGDIYTGNTPSKKNMEFYDSEDIMFIKPDMLEFNIAKIEKANEYISEKAREKARIIPKGSLLVSCIGNIGKLGINNEEVAFNQQINAIIHNDKIISSKYLAYVIKYNQKKLESIANTAVVPIINKNQFSEFELLIHKDLEIQNKIVDILDKAQQLIDKRKEQIEVLDELVKSQFIEMFGDPVSNYKQWQKRKLIDECNIVTGNTPSRKVDEYYGNYIEWIKSDNITDSNIYLTKAREYLSEKGLQVGRYVEENSILMTCIAGSIKCIGNVAIANRKIAFNQQINAIEPLNNNVFFMFEQFRLSQQYIQSTINMSLKGILSKGQLSELEFIFPPIELQNQFADFVKHVDKLKLEMENSLKELEDNFNSLMQRAFKGELFN